MSGQEQLETYLALNPVSEAEKEAYWNGGLNEWLNFARLNGVDYYPVATDVPGQGFNYAAQNTDWQDEVFRDAWIQNYYLSVDSGGKKIQQTFSANWFSQDGTIIGSWYNRLNLHYNASTDIKKWLRLGTSLNFSSTRSRWALNNNSQPGASVLSAAMAMAPWDPVSYPAGSLNYLGEDLGGGLSAASMFTNVVNPYSMAVHSYPKGSTERFVGSINLESALISTLTFLMSIPVSLRRNISILLPTRMTPTAYRRTRAVQQASTSTTMRPMPVHSANMTSLSWQVRP